MKEKQILTGEKQEQEKTTKKKTQKNQKNKAQRLVYNCQPLKRTKEENLILENLAEIHDGQKGTPAKNQLCKGTAA